ncbi:MAG TPA: hypothetical protein VKU41_12940 [Polyangiaceae bacterium]|nr:hypothetical protein [Polyangiaceae bacterium]
MLVGSAASAGCDQGPQTNQATNPGPAVQYLGSNVSAAMPLAPGGRIELAFDRLLLPASVTRQSFVLVDLRNNAFAPVVSYDPVARVVSIVPMIPLEAGLYKVIVGPQGPSDPNGPRAIDGAPLANAPVQVTFQANGLPDAGATEGGVSGPDAGPVSGAGLPPAPTINFCNDVFPIFVSKCSIPTCHGNTNLPAAGLLLDTPGGIQMTAVGEVAGKGPVAHGANTGPAPQAAPPGRVFGVDMPVIDRESPGPLLGDPANSWLVYKLLMAVPPPCSSTPGALPCDGGAAGAEAGTPADAGGTGMADAGADAATGDAGAGNIGSPPTNVGHAYDVAWVPMTSKERGYLSNLVQGREMPYPANPAASVGVATDPLTVDELERISLWIAQGSPLPACQ